MADTSKVHDASLMHPTGSYVPYGLLRMMYIKSAL